MGILNARERLPLPRTLRTADDFRGCRSRKLGILRDAQTSHADTEQAPGNVPVYTIQQHGLSLFRAEMGQSPR